MPSKRNTTKPSNLTTNLTDVLEARTNREEYTFAFMPGGTSYYYKGDEVIIEELFNSIFPVPEILPVRVKGDHVGTYIQ